MFKFDKTKFSLKKDLMSHVDIKNHIRLKAEDSHFLKKTGKFERRLNYKREENKRDFSQKVTKRQYYSQKEISSNIGIYITVILTLLGEFYMKNKVVFYDKYANKKSEHEKRGEIVNKIELDNLEIELHGLKENQ